MKNSRRSDRDLAKAIGVSQPTVSRLLRKLEKDGILKEYTMIPDFHKLGFDLLVLTFVKIQESGLKETGKSTRIIEDMKESLPEAVMVERGIGLGYDGVIVSFHKDFSSYMKFRERVTRFDYLELSGIESFLISLVDENRYLPLTFASLAKHLLMQKGK
jgi:DNA-binding Lrp family transcriptional regulator